MDNKTIGVAGGLSLCAPQYVPHHCHHCGGEVDCCGTHGLSCQWREGCFSSHVAMNNIIFHSLHSANVPSHLEHSGLLRSDGRQPDGISIISWKSGKC